MTLVWHKIAQALASYNYECLPIDISGVILEEFYDRIPKIKDDNKEIDCPRLLKSEAARRIFKLQRRGNDLRNQFGNDIITKVAAAHVIWPQIEKKKRPRIACLIDSLKHEEEIRYLRNLFGDAYFAIGVISTGSVRRNRLVSRKGFSKEEFDYLSEIDASEKGLEFGQSTVKAITQSDYFFYNDFTTTEQLDNEAHRLLRLIFSVGIDTPRMDEYGMNIALNAANQSGCLARQVGAAIVNSSGQLISTGRNDVPQYGGGLYTSESKKDMRCWSLNGQCSNDKYKLKIIDELTKKLVKIVDGGDGCSEHNIRSILQNSRIDSLIEFSRAVHAEMDAIIALAREGTSGLKGSTLYCTTFPCHNCAKHIIDAGIERVVYLEPYEKSLARDLHPDAIKDPLEGDIRERIPFDAFGGLAPRRYNQLFGIKRKRKNNIDGTYIDLDRERHNLVPIGVQDDELLQGRLKKVASLFGINQNS